MRDDGGLFSCTKCLEFFTFHNLGLFVDFTHLQRCACACKCFYGDEQCCIDINAKTISDVTTMSADDIYKHMNVKHLKVLFTAMCTKQFRSFVGLLPITMRKTTTNNPESWIHETIKIGTFLASTRLEPGAVVTKHDAFFPLRKLRNKYKHLDVDFVWVVKNDDTYHVFDAFCQKINPPPQPDNIFEIDGSQHFSAIGAIAAREIGEGGRLCPLRVVSANVGQMSKYEYVFILHEVVTWTGTGGDKKPNFVKAFPLPLDEFATHVEQSETLLKYFHADVDGFKRVRVPGFVRDNRLYLVRYNLITSRFDVIETIESDKLVLCGPRKPSELKYKFARARRKYVYVDKFEQDECVETYDIYMNVTTQKSVLALRRPLVNILDDSVVLF